MTSIKSAMRVLAGIGLGAVFVATVLPINFAALAIWAVLVVSWTRQRVRVGQKPAAIGVVAVQVAILIGITTAAILAPVKVVDQVEARRVTLSKPEFTMAELEDPVEFGLSAPFHFGINAPKELAARVVRFPSTELTVGEFAAAIEAQTPLRHRFNHCGNGWTILWGGDCSFGLRFSVPSPSY